MKKNLFISMLVTLLVTSLSMANAKTIRDIKKSTKRISLNKKIMSKSIRQQKQQLKLAQKKNKTATVKLTKAHLKKTNKINLVKNQKKHPTIKQKKVRLVQKEKAPSSIKLVNIQKKQLKLIQKKKAKANLTLAKLNQKKQLVESQFKPKFFYGKSTKQKQAQQKYQAKQLRRAQQKKLSTETKLARLNKKTIYRSIFKTLAQPKYPKRF